MLKLTYKQQLAGYEIKQHKMPSPINTNIMIKSNDNLGITFNISP